MTNRFDAARLQPMLIVAAFAACVLAALLLLVSGRAASGQAERRELTASLAASSRGPKWPMLNSPSSQSSCTGCSQRTRRP